MKWNRWIIKAAKIITKFTELGYWMTAALMLTAGMGLVILCLTQFFARGVELEQDVEGLV